MVWFFNQVKTHFLLQAMSNFMLAVSSGYGSTRGSCHLFTNFCKWSEYVQWSGWNAVSAIYCWRGLLVRKAPLSIQNDIYTGLPENSQLQEVSKVTLLLI